MQAIITRFLPPTNYRGARIKAFCERGSIVTPYGSLSSTDDEHLKAAAALVSKFCREDLKERGEPIAKNPWNRPRVMGWHPNGDAVHVYI